MPVIEIKNLDFSFGKSKVLNNISFDLEKGEFVGIIGPNGAGKSTLLKIMNGILPIHDQNVLFNGIPVKRIRRKLLAQKTAYVPQETNFAFPYSVRDIVAMGRYPYSSAFAALSIQDEKIIDQVMNELEVKTFAERDFQSLSGGEKQRVIIASALAQQPQVLFLDEPTSALDLHHQIGIYRILKNLQRSQQLSIIVVTHDINLAAQFCQRLILLSKGKIVSDGKPEDVLLFPVLQEVFGVQVYIDINPITKSLYILPYG